ncbi:hypothetical protein VTJ83DRAFT_6114 [Remersonia thermophila]|uniref:DUF676 domain-containing protein n=1 Tax=Remersonia thermophila TaxID=72144 RepID=A0ABR4DAY7_9PEZI
MRLRQLYPDESGGGGSAITLTKPLAIDIVFVHGLDSTDPTLDGRRTWTADDERRTCWPRDMLPKSMPHARVLCYEYNSTVKGTTSEAGTRDYATKLLHELTRYRKHTFERARPIIFVAHSLGGNIVKRALSLAHIHSQPQFNAIVAVTIGIVFFSTPHRVSNDEDGKQLYQRILRAAGSRTVKDVVLEKCRMVEPPPQMLQEIGANAGIISDITHNFTPLLHENKYNIKIHNFNEELKFPGLRRTVVSKEQASLDVAEAVALHGNHFTICKFADDEKGKSSFESVKSVLEDMVESAANPSSIPPTGARQQRLSRSGADASGTKGAKQPASHQERMDAVFATALHQFSDRIYPTEGTGQWIVRRPAFNAWMNGKLNHDPGRFQAQKLCLIGKPASGKTHLAKQIIGEIRKRHHFPVLECFLDAKWTNRSSCGAILQSTLVQLVSARPQLLWSLEPECPMPERWPSEKILEVWPRLVATTIQQGQPIAIVIDGFTEISDRDQKAFLECLARCEKDYGLVEQDLQKLRILVLSRDCEILSQRGFTKYEISNDDVAEDIRRTVRQNLDDFAKGLGYTEDEQTLICNEVTSGAQGIYLWATVVMDDLRKMKRLREGQLKKHLRELPRPLAELFDRILHKICEQGDIDERMARWILLWVIHGLEPLTVEELREAVTLTSFRARNKHVRATEASLEDEPIPEAEAFRSLMVSICGPLLRMSGDYVEPIHRTLAEFLTTSTEELKKRGSWNIPTHTTFYMPEGKSNAKLGRLCVDYLSMDAFHSVGDPFNNNDQGARWEMKVQARIERYPLVRYSALCWLGHMRLAGDDWDSSHIAKSLENVSNPCTQSWCEVWWFCRKWREPYPFVNGNRDSLSSIIAMGRSSPTALVPRPAPSGSAHPSIASEETLVDSPSQPSLGSGSDTEGSPQQKTSRPHTTGHECEVPIGPSPTAPDRGMSKPREPSEPACQGVPRAREPGYLDVRNKLPVLPSQDPKVYSIPEASRPPSHPSMQGQIQHAGGNITNTNTNTNTNTTNNITVLGEYNSLTGMNAMPPERAEENRDHRRASRGEQPETTPHRHPEAEGGGGDGCFKFFLSLFCCK